MAGVQNIYVQQLLRFFVILVSLHMYQTFYYVLSIQGNIKRALTLGVLMSNVLMLNEILR